MKKNKNKNIEMKIYELLGVKVFKKIVMKLYEKYFHYLRFGLGNDIRDNYIMGNVQSIEDIKNFKKMFYFNASIHLFNLYCCFSVIMTVDTFTFIRYIIYIIIDCYCVMLQRYNCIRMNKVINKQNQKYEEQMKEELREEDLLLEEHTYKIINIRNRKREVKNITFEELIANANIEQLEKYRECLMNFKYYSREHETFIEKNKILKLELVQNSSTQKF